MYDPDSPLLRTPAAATARGLPEPQAKARFAEDRVREAVLRCAIAPGATISEAAVMGRFGLTRAAARAALARLGHEGWAQPMPRLGWQVLPVSGALIGDTFAARLVAEPPAFGALRLDAARTGRLETLSGMIEALHRDTGAAARGTLETVVCDLDHTLLGATDVFTARHLRGLWHHTARIARHLDVAAAIAERASRAARPLVAALLAGDGADAAAHRRSLIADQQALILQALLNNDAALGPGSAPARRPETETAAHNGRPI